MLEAFPLQSRRPEDIFPSGVPVFWELSLPQTVVIRVRLMINTGEMTHWWRDEHKGSHNLNRAGIHLLGACPQLWCHHFIAKMQTQSARPSCYHGDQSSAAIVCMWELEWVRVTSSMEHDLQMAPSKLSPFSRHFFTIRTPPLGSQTSSISWDWINVTVATNQEWACWKTIF